MKHSAAISRLRLIHTISQWFHECTKRWCFTFQTNCYPEWCSTDGKNIEKKKKYQTKGSQLHRERPQLSTLMILCQGVTSGVTKPITLWETTVVYTDDPVSGGHFGRDKTHHIVRDHSCLHWWSCVRGSLRAWQNPSHCERPQLSTLMILCQGVTSGVTKPITLWETTVVNTDVPVSGGHFGRDKTHMKVTKRYHWSRMNNDIAEYV